MKTINFEKLPEIFRGIKLIPSTLKSYTIKYKIDRSNISAEYSQYDTCRFVIGENKRDDVAVYFTNSRNERIGRSFYTNFPFLSYEEFRSNMERIGINLRYISDEENE